MAQHADHRDDPEQVEGQGAESQPHRPVAALEGDDEVDQAQLARAVSQLASVGSAWDARLRRIKRIAETIQRDTTKRA